MIPPQQGQDDSTDAALERFRAQFGEQSATPMTENLPPVSFPEDEPQVSSDEMSKMLESLSSGEQFVKGGEEIGGASEPSGGLFGALEQTRRPQAAVFQGFISATENLQEGDDPVTAFAGAGYDAVQEFFAFKNRPTMHDVLEVGGTPDFPFRGFVEFAGDVLLDPLWFVPVGAIGRVVGKGADVVRVAGRYTGAGMLAMDRAYLPTKAVLEGLEKGLNATKKGLYGAITLDGRNARRAAVISQRALDDGSDMVKSLEIIREKSILVIAAETGDDVADIRTAITASTEVISINEPFVKTLAKDVGGLVGDMDFADLEDLSAAVMQRGKFNADPWISKLSKEAQEAISPIVDDLQRGYIEVFKRDVAFGVGTKAMESERIAYALHAIHPEAKEAMMIYLADKSLSGLQWSPDHASKLMRMFKNLGITEINDLAMSGKLSKMGIPAGMPMFIDNPAMLEAIRLERSARAIAGAKLRDRLVKDYGEMVPSKLKKLSDAAKLEPETVIKWNSDQTRIMEIRKAAYDSGLRPLDKVKGYKNWWLPEEVADVVNKHYIKTFIEGDETANTVFKMYRSVTSVWKASVTTIFPSFHGRNALGNFWNNFLAGMDNPLKVQKYYGNGGAALIQRVMKAEGMTSQMVADLAGEAAVAAKKAGASGKAIKEGADTVITLGRRRYTIKELVDAMQEQGVFAGGAFRQDILGAAVGASTVGERLAPKAANLSASLASKVVKAPVTLAKGAARVGGRVGAAVENNARMAHFLWRLDKGDDYLSAGKSVAKYLFDYDDIGPWADSARRWAIPFASWSRKNIPLQLEHMVTDPWKTGLINKARNSIESHAGLGVSAQVFGKGESASQAPEDRILADYVRTGMGIRTRRNGDEYDYYLMGNWIPQADLAEIGLFDMREGIGRAGKVFGNWVVGMMNPILTTLIEQGTDVSLFRNRPFLVDRKKFVGFRFSEASQALLRNARILSEFDRLIMNPKGENVNKRIMKFLLPIPRKVTINTRKAESFRIQGLERDAQEQVSAANRLRRAGDMEGFKLHMEQARKIREQKR